MRAFPRAGAATPGGAALATTGQIMTQPSCPLVLTFAAALALAGATTVAASDPPLNDAIPHIRAFDPQMQALVAEATATSATVRELLERITASDVIVFLECERKPTRAAGRLNFVTAAGGVRYVVIRLKPLERHIAIAMLAHELQHAAEIAATPSIVDEASLAREYARIGFRSHALHGVAFDTKAAVDVGRRVVHELMEQRAGAAD